MFHVKVYGVRYGPANNLGHLGSEEFMEGCLYMVALIASRSPS